MKRCIYKPAAGPGISGVCFPLELDDSIKAYVPRYASQYVRIFNPTSDGKQFGPPMLVGVNKLHPAPGETEEL